MAREIYGAIIKAAKKGAGLRLTAAEVRELASDSAIETVAANRQDGIEGDDRVMPGFSSTPIPK